MVERVRERENDAKMYDKMLIIGTSRLELGYSLLHSFSFFYRFKIFHNLKTIFNYIFGENVSQIREYNFLSL